MNVYLVHHTHSDDLAHEGYDSTEVLAGFTNYNAACDYIKYNFASDQNLVF